MFNAPRPVITGNDARIVGYDRTGIPIYDKKPTPPSLNPNFDPGSHSTPEESIRKGEKLIDQRVAAAVPNRDELREFAESKLTREQRIELNKELESGLPDQMIQGWKRIEGMMLARQSVAKSSSEYEDTKTAGGFTSWEEMNRVKGETLSEVGHDGMNNLTNTYAVRLAQTPMRVIQGGSIEPDGRGKFVPRMAPTNHTPTHLPQTNPTD